MQKRFWRTAYGLWGPRGYGFYAPGSRRTFMNYGYAPLDATAEGERGFGAALYDRVAGGADLRGADVLEVGCGLGAGAAHVLEHHGAASVVGVDLSRRSIERARAALERPRLRFVAGDAEALPFPDASFDAVLNVESSHCYPDVGRFLDEAARVLRPGGVLLLADIRYVRPNRDQDGGLVQIGHAGALREHLTASRLDVVEEEDLTANVLRALELDSPRRRALIDRDVPRPLRPLLRLVAGVEGGALHDDYASGRLCYMRFVARRPAG